MSRRLWTAVDACACGTMRSVKRVVVVALLACACGPAAAPYRPRPTPGVAGWWCSAMSTGEASLCVRTEEQCRLGAHSMQSTRGVRFATFSDCAPQPVAHCFTHTDDRRVELDACFADEHTCELARSRAIQGTYRPGLKVGACGRSE